MVIESGDEMQALKGIAASNGIAIGKLKLCVKLDDKIAKKPITDVEAEIKRVESAKEELRPWSWVTDDREQPYYKRIVINAQTGEIEPMVITDEKQIYCPTVVTW